ncbi:MAG: nickel pincer cofactor biosynthesis protein LarC [Planctomycetia bacterium]|nr:nickel pincer cofactor biosynthesis protein LarC [Planctomycetia bacterium]
MRTAHFDCFSGISGDMTLAALISAGVPIEVLREGLASLQLPIELEVEEVIRGCFAATYVQVKALQEQPQRFLKDIQTIIHAGKLTPGARDLALAIFQKLGEAEAAAHGMNLDQVHFHEVGALDSIADIVGSAIGLDYLQLDHVTARSVPTGHGTVKAAHGLMPIPTPATATLLKGVPLASSTIKGELTTPTGAAILSTIVNEWCESPLMTIHSIGYGAGTKDFAEQPNILRLFLGHHASQDSRASMLQDEVWMLETNVDDVAGEIIAYCTERLLQAGALDVFTIPIHMKKQRPGVMVCVITIDIKMSQLEEILFQELHTLGIRRTKYQRHKLSRQEKTIKTPWGDLLAKEIVLAKGEKLLTPEFEVCAQIARTHQIPLWKVYQAIEKHH